jgi:PAS domain S-box-containing protein
MLVLGILVWKSAGLVDQMDVGRKQVQQALLQRHQRFQALIENSFDAIALFSARGTILYASPSNQRVLGYSSEELVGRSTFELVHPDDLTCAKKLFSELLATPGTTVSGQYCYCRKDGSWRWMESFGMNLLAAPAVQAVVSNYRDITERKRAEETASHLAAIVQSSADAIIGKTLDGQIVSWNEGAELIYGYTAAEVIGRPVSILAPPDRPDEIPLILEGLRRGNA